MIDQMQSVCSHRQSDIGGMVSLLERAAEDPQGPTQWPTGLSHLADKKNGIYQFIKGDLRLFYFYDVNRIIVCTNVGLKQSQKVDPKDVRDAIGAKNEYFAAKEQGEVIWLNDEEE